MRKIILGTVAAIAVAAPLALSAAPANAADGQQYIVRTATSRRAPNGDLTCAQLTTDFALATNQTQGTDDNRADTMWEPGRYVIGTNPNAFHVYWADFGANANDPMMFVNGFQNENAEGVVADHHARARATPGSKITFDFTANATNILPPENVPDAPGANISVTINGTPIGSQDLTGVNPGNVVQFVGAVPWAPDDGGHRLEQRHGVLRQRLRDRRHLAGPARRDRAAVPGRHTTACGSTTPASTPAPEPRR